MNETMDNRLIQAFYYSIGGLGLGIALAITWSFYIDSQTSSVHINLITMFLSGLCGFLFPHSVAHIFKFFWNLFR